MITRRRFIATTSVSALALSLMPEMLVSGLVPKQIGLQLYTVRDLMAKDLQGTLAKVAEAGYTWLEAAGYSEGKFYGLAPNEFRKIADGYGMRVISSHVSFSPEESRQVIDAHLELGAEYVVFPWMDKALLQSQDDYLQKADLFNQLGEACNISGLRFAYHNHDFEFITFEDTTGYDILLNRTEPKSVVFEADFYWMIYAGVDPLVYIRNYPGRFGLWHIKDMDDGPDKSFVPVGTGIIDFTKIFTEKEIAGMEYFFVEQDQSKGDPLKSIATSFQYLVKIAY